MTNTSAVFGQVQETDLTDMKHIKRRLNSAPTSHLRVRRRGVSQALISQDPPNQQQERPSALRHPIIYHSLGGDFTPAFTCLVLNNRTKCTKFTCDQHCCQLYLHVSSARSSLRHSNILFVTRVI